MKDVGIGIVGIVFYLIVAVGIPIATIAGGIWLYNEVIRDEPTSSYRDDIEVKQDYTPSSPVAGISKSEYIDLATRNCSKTESESFCRCYYTLFMENNSVEETFRQDSAAVDPNYVYTDEQLNIAAKCIGN